MPHGEVAHVAFGADGRLDAERDVGVTPDEQRRYVDRRHAGA
jgi:hypothetical protein